MRCKSCDEPIESWEYPVCSACRERALVLHKSTQAAIAPLPSADVDWDNELRQLVEEGA